MDPLELSFINFSNAEELERYYAKYLEDPQSVDPSFAFFFKGISFQGLKGSRDSKLSKIKKIIDTYRKFGHLKAKLNPVALDRKEEFDYFSLPQLGISQSELNEVFPSCGILEEKEAPLSKIIERLELLYCSTLGVECSIPLNPALEEFIYHEIETSFAKQLTVEKKKIVLTQLNKAEAFEAFIQLRYPGQKRFSIEGGESFIPLIEEVIHSAKEAQVKEIVLGMAHRGRLNVLANVMHKPYEEIFSEFEPKSKNFREGLSGDVKYHKGYFYKDQDLSLTLCPNPSHLEAVDPVVLGRSRAKMLKMGNLKQVLPITIHGDAAVAGQGIVYETLQMDGLEGFQTGGVLHIVINNQIGFTAKSEEGRSTLYCTDVAKGFSLPIFHVNGEDPEMCVKVAALACKIRQEFQTSVFIDYNCYRKYGHNETDEPRFTSPKLYDLIAKKETMLSIYRAKLVQENVLSSDEILRLEEEFKAVLNTAHSEVEKVVLKEEAIHKSEPYQPIVNTHVAKDVIEFVADKLSVIPDGFSVHPKLKKMIQDRKENLLKSYHEPALDFATCEHFAYATLLLEGFPIRIVGEDSRRGTFSHRHAVLIDQKTEEPYYQLNYLKENQEKITVYNSFLSEYAAMGYEYGFSVENPKTLVMWEAQFGDFANCAQVIIDQFLASSYQKWSEESSLILLLPHGYEGMGPEHSSARIERFLQLAAQNNMEIIYPTKASQMFHLLRHQALKKHKTPMIVFAPKALLRHKESYARAQDLIETSFLDLIDDQTVDKKQVEKLIFTTGKLIYELKPLQNRELEFSAVISIEKLFPFNEALLKEIVKKYPKMNRIVLAQEEPMNMGSIRFLKELFAKNFPTIPIQLVARKESASTAAGSAVLHQFEQELLIKALIEA
jgi:2-oxoglutarate dehydrogenase E1 component